MPLSTVEKEIKGLVTSDGAPEILVDGFNRASVINGIARLNLYSHQTAAEGQHTATLVCRLAISVTALVSFRRQIDSFVDDLIKNGVAEEVSDDDS